MRWPSLRRLRPFSSRPARAPVPFADAYHDGYVLTLWDADVPPDALAALFARMKATGARHLTVPVFGCQSDPASADVGACDVASRALDLARAGREHGLTVGLLPILAGAHGEWRGLFEPRDREAWFDGYTRWIVARAREAQAIGASDLVVGSELTKLYRRAKGFAGVGDVAQRPAGVTPAKPGVWGRSRPHRDKGWSRVLTEVRRAFSGPLVVTVNWSDLDLDFWDDADAIGVSAYHPLAAKPDAGQDDLDAGWRAVRDEILRVARAHGRPVHISEVGYPSMTHAAQRPWDVDTRSPPDPALQARCFEAFRRAWEGVPELVRVNVWAAGDPRAEDPLGYETFGKPAEAVLRRLFQERAARF